MVRSDNGATLVRSTPTTFSKERVDGGALDDELRATRAAKGVGPVVTAAGNGWFHTARVAGRRRAQLSDDDVAAVGRALARLHAVRVPKVRALPGGATLRATLAEAETCAAWLKREGALDDGAARAASRLMKRTRAALDDLFIDEDARALCHGDVRSPNLLFHEGEARLLDFGLAGRGDPAIDLARFFAYERLDAHRRFVAAHAYAEEAGADDVVDRAFAMVEAMPVALALSALRYALLAARGKIAVSDPRAFSKRAPELRRRVKDLLRAADDAVAARLVPAEAPPSIPRVPHLPGSKLGRDDLVVDDEKRFRTKRAAVVEKLDGVAVAFYVDGAGDIDVVMKREWRNALHGEIERAARRWARAHEGVLRKVLAGGGKHLLGEWLLHRLVVRYAKLPSAVIFHSLVVDGALVPRLKSNALLSRAGLAVMKPHITGVVGERAWSALLPKRSAVGAARPEGIIVEVLGRWAKWVAPHYRQPQPGEMSGERNRVRAG